MFEGKAFDIEHALSMFAYSFFVLPASAIYDEELLKEYTGSLSSFHIYAIGSLPKIEPRAVTQADDKIVTSYLVAGEQKELVWPVPSGATLEIADESWWLVDGQGDKLVLDEKIIARRLNAELDAIGFEVLYIGQAYGKDGSRHALDRLIKHETLQKIALQEIPETRRLHVLLLQIQPATSLITVINPFAKDNSRSDDRISKGLDKLYNTNEAERVSLYEAALIRYFQPRYNKEFKNSFPSTNMKLLADCYDKDFSAVVAEICFDALPFKMFTETIAPQQYHIAKFDLHEQEARRVFFS